MAPPTTAATPVAPSLHPQACLTRGREICQQGIKRGQDILERLRREPHKNILNATYSFLDVAHSLNRETLKAAGCVAIDAGLIALTALVLGCAGPLGWGLWYGISAWLALEGACTSFVIGCMCFKLTEYFQREDADIRGKLCSTLKLNEDLSHDHERLSKFILIVKRFPYHEQMDFVISFGHALGYLAYEMPSSISDSDAYKLMEECYKRYLKIKDPSNKLETLGEFIVLLPNLSYCLGHLRYPSTDDRKTGVSDVNIILQARVDGLRKIIQWDCHIQEAQWLLNNFGHFYRNRFISGLVKTNLIFRVDTFFDKMNVKACADFLSERGVDFMAHQIRDLEKESKLDGSDEALKAQIQEAAHETFVTEDEPFIHFLVDTCMNIIAWQNESLASTEVNVR